MAHVSGNFGTDAQLTNKSSKSARINTDLDLFFTRRTNKDVSVVEDIQAVKRSIRNLVQFNPHEKPFHPEISSGVRDLLFENMSPVTSVVLARKVEDVITNFEPRARLQSVRAIPRFDDNAYEVTVDFYVRNYPTELLNLDLFLERLR